MDALAEIDIGYRALDKVMVCIRVPFPTQVIDIVLKTVVSFQFIERRIQIWFDAMTDASFCISA